MWRSARRIRSVVSRLVTGRLLLLIGAAMVALEAGVVFRQTFFSDAPDEAEGAEGAEGPEGRRWSHTFSSDAPDEAVARERAQSARRTTLPSFPPWSTWPLRGAAVAVAATYTRPLFSLT
jgi:hypothetical protein